jgi:hypothetical protein
MAPNTATRPLPAPRLPAAACCLSATLLMAAGVPATELIDVPAARDATLIEDPEGARANGAGPALFAGRTAQGDTGRRRALLLFDVAAVLPREAVVTNALLTLHMTPSNAVPAEIAVHRVLAPWSEGPALSTGGSGAPAMPGDSTWLHRRYDDQLWVFPGGQFVPEPSAALTVADAGFYSWQDSPRLLADVRAWHKAPQRNFGWILIGDEEAPQSVKRFDSRESLTPEYRPVLSLEYELPGRGSSEPPPPR